MFANYTSSPPLASLQMLHQCAKDCRREKRSFSREQLVESRTPLKEQWSLLRRGVGL